MSHVIENTFRQSRVSLGTQGEGIACQFLEKHGFRIIERNYRKKWGEIDIVAEREERSRGAFHFFEVKSVSSYLSRLPDAAYKPEDNVHLLKARRLRKTISTYLAEHTRRGNAQDMPFYFHVLCVFMDLKTRRARIRWLKDIIL